MLGGEQGGTTSNVNRRLRPSSLLVPSRNHLLPSNLHLRRKVLDVRGVQSFCSLISLVGALPILPRSRKEIVIVPTCLCIAVDGIFLLLSLAS